MFRRSLRVGLAREGKNGLCPIRFRLSFSGTRLDLRLGCSIEKSKWNDTRQRMKANTTSVTGMTSNEVNRAIENALVNLNSFFDKRDILGMSEPTEDEIRHEWNMLIGKSEADGSNKIGALSNLYLSERSCSKEWTENSYELQKTVLKKLVGKFGNINVNSLDESHLKSLMTDFQKQDLKNSSIETYIRIIKTFLKFCHDKGFYLGTLHQTFTPKIMLVRKKAVSYLEWDELMAFYNVELPKNLARIRDEFCFCCFTGLRFSDISKIKQSDIHDDLLFVVATKTRTALSINLNKYSKAILQRANNNQSDVYVFRRYQPSYYNEQVREIAKICNLDRKINVTYFKGNNRYDETYPLYEVISSHCARRTFVVTSMRLGIPSEVIMKWTGHSRLESMKPYMEIVNEYKSEQMAKFDTFEQAPKKAPEKDAIG